MKAEKKLQELQELVDQNKNSLNEMLNDMAEEQGVDIDEIDIDELDCDEYKDDYIVAMALLDQLDNIERILNK